MSDRFGMNDDGTADDIVIDPASSVHVEDLGSEIFIAVHRPDGTTVDLRAQTKDGGTSGCDDVVRLVLMDDSSDRKQPKTDDLPDRMSDERLTRFKSGDLNDAGGDLSYELTMELTDALIAERTALTASEERVEARDEALRQACVVLHQQGIGEHTTDPDKLTTHTVDEWVRWFVGRGAAALDRKGE